MLQNPPYGGMVIGSPTGCIIHFSGSDTIGHACCLHRGPFVSSTVA